MALSAISTPLPDRFIVLRDGRTVSIAPDRKRAEQIARHFKRLQPRATVIVQDLATDDVEEL